MKNEALQDFCETCSDDQAKLIQTLTSLGQEPLFADWDPAGVRDEEKQAFLKQLSRVNQNYPGGLTHYIQNAQKLLAEARDDVNPFEGFVPHKPATVDLSAMDGEYDRIEALGAEAFHKTGIVMVAGGLGERLGYSGIKLGIPVEVIEHSTYLNHYASSLLAMQDRMIEPRPMPFVIMTSDDTHDRTVAEFENNHYFGLQPDQIHLLKQELVPALTDNNARIALEGKYTLQLKPHGHGDVHMLLHTSGVAAKLHAEGIEYLVFIQDTNGQVFNVVPAAVGVSIDQQFDFNSLGVNRVPGEAVGGITRLVRGEEEITVNVEYNQLDPLLRSTISPEGDVPGENGFSLFPGNVNVLVIGVAAYVKALEKSKGIIAEFVNPKYADQTRTTFKKPTRLETMMQDLPKVFRSGEKVGVTVFDRAWCFSPNKNKIEDAAAKHKAASPPESAATAESDFYWTGRKKLVMAGVNVEEEKPQLIQGIPFTDGPRVILRPSFAVTLQEVRDKISGGSISGKATLILDGKGIQLDNVSLQGPSALVIHAAPGARVCVTGTLAPNAGYSLQELNEEERQSGEIQEVIRMRGYQLMDRGATVLHYEEAGEYALDLSTLKK